MWLKSSWLSQWCLRWEMYKGFKSRLTEPRVELNVLFRQGVKKNKFFFGNPPPPRLYFCNISKIFPELLLTEVTKILANVMIFAVEQRLQLPTMTSFKRSLTTWWPSQGDDPFIDIISCKSWWILGYSSTTGCPKKWLIELVKSTFFPQNRRF